MMKQVRQVAMYQRIARQQQQATEFALQACMQATMNMSMMGASYAMIYSQMLEIQAVDDHSLLPCFHKSFSRIYCNVDFGVLLLLGLYLRF